MDLSRMERGVRDFLEGLELSTKDDRFRGDELERTPERVARAWRDDLVSGYAVDARQELTWIDAPAHAGPVVVRGVRFASVCVHHLLPFFGEAHVAYLPDRRLAGLSKIGRVVDAWSRRLQTQERLTSQILDTLHEVLEPRGVLVLLEAAHTCMTLRGVRKEQSRMTTLGAAGLYDTDAAARGEMLGLLRSERGAGG